jgi:hypothetical protein
MRNSQSKYLDINDVSFQDFYIEQDDEPYPEIHKFLSNLVTRVRERQRRVREDRIHKRESLFQNSYRKALHH